MRVFLSGATGVIGRRVLSLLVSGGHRVTAVGRSLDKRRALEAKGANAIDVDLFDESALRLALAGHDTVINLATHMPSSFTKMLIRWNWRENDHIRREGSAALVNAALASGVTRFIQESFAPIYADGGDRWLDETSPVRTVSYNRTVLDAERSAERFSAGTAGQVGIVTRFAAFYGPDSRVTHELLGMMRRGWAPLPGSPSAFLSSISHDDAATAVVAALEAPSGIYNVCDDEPLRRAEWFDAFANAYGIGHLRPLPDWVSTLGGSIMELMGRSLRLTNAKLRAATGWAPKYPSVREGFQAMAAAAPSERAA